MFVCFLAPLGQKVILPDKQAYNGSKGVGYIYTKYSAFLRWAEGPSGPKVILPDERTIGRMDGRTTGRTDGRTTGLRKTLKEYCAVTVPLPRYIHTMDDTIHSRLLYSILYPY